MVTILLVLYVAVCAFLILVVLLQSGKAGDLASTFGATSSQTAFGSRGTATLLSRLTSGLAIAFMLLAFGITVLQVRSRARESVLTGVDAATGPAATGATAPTGAGPETAPDAGAAPPAALPEATGAAAAPPADVPAPTGPATP